MARDPDEGSSLPFVVKLPLASGDVVLKVRDTWPRTAKVYCHRVDDGWPTGADLEVVERVAVRAWARDAGFPIADRGRIHPEIYAAYRKAHPES